MVVDRYVEGRIIPDSMPALNRMKGKPEPSVAVRKTSSHFCDAFTPDSIN
jgi:hypothetical protein